jgi:SNF2 family DNA or RNA helicase
VGSGKTITAITIVRCLLEKNPNQEIFVLTPTSLIDNFNKEIEKLGVQFGGNMKVYSHGVFVNKVKDSGPQFCKDAVLVIDEAHNFKTKIKAHDGSRAETMMTATAAAKQVFLLTATPIQNRPSEFANLYAMITGNEHEVKGLYNKFDYGSPSDLRKMLDKKISYYKNNDLNDYPTVDYFDIELYMTDNYYKLYKEVEENQSALFQEFFLSKDAAVFYNGIRRAVNSIDGNTTTPKIEWAINHIKESVEKRKKVLMYSNWLQAGLGLVQTKLTELGIEWVEVNGKMTAAKRKNAILKYNTGEILVLFISSAGAEGLDLKGTRSVIVLEPHWNNEKMKQVVGRAVRYKSHSALPPDERHVDIYYLVLKKPQGNKDKMLSADDMLLEIAEKKEVQTDKFYSILMQSSI